MSDPDSSSSRSRIPLAAGALLLLLAGAAWWLRGSPETPGAAPSEGRPARTVPSFAVPAKDAPAVDMAAETSVPSWSGALPVTVLPGHEGHGDECAECVAERKLAVYREDYAQLQFSLALQGRVLPADLSGELQDACRRFSRAVLREWSFSDSKPRLPDDAAVAILRSEMLQPLIERLPPVADDTP